MSIIERVYIIQLVHNTWTIHGVSVMYALSENMKPSNVQTNMSAMV